MDGTVTVFVDDAVLGRRPTICVKDGVFTGDHLIHCLEIGDRGRSISTLTPPGGGSRSTRVHPNFVAVAGRQALSWEER